MARASKAPGRKPREGTRTTSGRATRAEAPKGRRAGTRRAEAPKGRAARTSGRYTAPIPHSVKRSPRWYPWVLLTMLVLGALAIILNYIDVLPASPTSWYVVGGMLAILGAAVMATRYR
ncbi:MAG TPA: cell division protein CrgA [Acidimicrobiales bacterium]|nr:cell division protein CrgA [Acidimicrobiales bacterium]